MTAPIAPILARIASIESRFGNNRLPMASSQGRTFVQALDAAVAPTDGIAPARPGVDVAPNTSRGLDLNTVRPLGTDVLRSIQDRPDVAVPTGGNPWVAAGATAPSYGYVPGSNAAVAAGPAPVFTGSTEALPPGGAVTPGTPFADLYEAEGARHGVPAQLLAAVGWVESRYSVDALSPDGAIGVMQIMPETARGLGVNPHDPAQAIEGAARLLVSNRERFGNWDLALAAYHSGGGAVSRAGNQPPPRAAEYVRLVHARLESM